MALLTPDWPMPSSAAARTKLRRSPTLTNIVNVLRSIAANSSPKMINHIISEAIVHQGCGA
jgi:hypothetical protein